jgi:predicted nucleic acid-binding protein
MIVKAFLDTDVIIDFLIDREPFSSDSSQLFELAETNRLTLITSSLCIHNIHYFINKKLDSKKAVAIIADLMELIDVQCTCKKHIDEAAKSGFSDFEDAIQNSVASELKVDVILTRNIKDFKKSNLLVQTPKEFLLTEAF